MHEAAWANHRHWPTRARRSRGVTRSSCVIKSSGVAWRVRQRSRRWPHLALIILHAQQGGPAEIVLVPHPVLLQGGRPYLYQLLLFFAWHLSAGMGRSTAPASTLSTAHLGPVCAPALRRLAGLAPLHYLQERRQVQPLQPLLRAARCHPSGPGLLSPPPRAPAGVGCSAQTDQLQPGSRRCQAGPAPNQTPHAGLCRSQAAAWDAMVAAEGLRRSARPHPHPACASGDGITRLPGLCAHNWPWKLRSPG